MSPHASIGASGKHIWTKGFHFEHSLGAIFGIGGALAMFAWRHKKLLGPSGDTILKQLRDTAVINFTYGLIVRHIDNW